MSLTKGKHTVKEINGTRCSIIEKDTSHQRALFLKKLLQHNGFEVVVQKNETTELPSEEEKEIKGKEGINEEAEQRIPETWSIGVTDLTFNPVIAIYERSLKTLDNQLLTPAYWNGRSKKGPGWYWIKNELKFWLF